MSRGRDATAPTEIPAKGWKDVFWRVKSELAEDHIGLISAGVAFYALLALFPTITALMALAGLILDPSDITEQMATVAAVIPEAAAEIVLDQAVSVAGSGSAGLGFAFVFSLGLALYSASRGVASLVEGLNVAYDETETRGFFRLLATNLALTGLMVVGLIAGLIATLAVPAALSWIGLPDWAETAVGLASWVVLGLLTITGLAALYRWGPNRADAKWRWLTPGALTSAALWLIASIGFSVYVSNFSSYNESFGSMAGVIILLTWLWLSAYIVLLGAELNSEIEAQTAQDSTTGPAQPMGERGAEKADSLGAKAD
jgi:membrane protein